MTNLTIYLRESFFLVFISRLVDSLEKENYQIKIIELFWII